MQGGQMLECGIAPETILLALEEVEKEIRNNGKCLKERAWLFHQLGSIHGLMGDLAQQKDAWEQALKLDPDNETLKASLKSLE